MATNGATDLEAGPEAGWLGYYSLDKAGRLGGGESLEALITQAGDTGLIWTDPEVSHVTTNNNLLQFICNVFDQRKIDAV